VSVVMVVVLQQCICRYVTPHFAEIRLSTLSATNTKYLSLCSRSAVSLDLYTNCDQCSTFPWKRQ
jgi:hypothetical protein